ncbi:50S ribosomal protein L23 [Candidatus Woesearchaeota archaeon]|nr:50S ribosomal protein L23 [Candidatus Woesearchaeota archaeon]
MTLQYPLATEKSVRYIDTENKLVFIVDRKATKAQIKAAVENQLGAKVLKVNTLNDSKGHKKAYIQFSPETPAIDVATKLGLM